MTPKFRRWDKINKVMLQHKEIPVLLKNARDDNQFVYMLWTGLLDKAGVEIFEGDVVHFVDPKCYARPKVFKSVVKWFQEGCSYLCDEIGTDKSHGLHEFSIPEIEVIGNVHDNPELIDGRK